MPRVTREDLEAALHGGPPVEQPEALDAWLTVERLRTAFTPTTPVQPSAKLAALLDLDYLAARTAGTQADVPHTVEVSAPPVAQAAPVAAAPRTGQQVRRLLGWLAGLGAAAQVGLGTTAALAAVAAVGAAGELPERIQRHFDDLVGIVTPGEGANNAGRPGTSTGEPPADPEPVSAPPRDDRARGGEGTGGAGDGRQKEPGRDAAKNEGRDEEPGTSEPAPAGPPEPQAPASNGGGAAPGHSDRPGQGSKDRDGDEDDDDHDDDEPDEDDDERDEPDEVEDRDEDEDRDEPDETEDPADELEDREEESETDSETESEEREQPGTKGGSETDDDEDPDDS